MSDETNIDIHLRGKLDPSVQQATEGAKETIKDLKQEVVDQVADMAGASRSLTTVLAGVGVGFTAVAVSAYGLWKAYEAGTEEMTAMNVAIARTGDFAGETRGNLRELAAEISSTSQLTIGQSKEMVTALAATGQIGSQAFGAVAQMAAEYGRVMGVETDKIAPQLAKLFADPAKGAAELNSTLHFLTATELEHIRTLEDSGLAGEAQAELAEKFRIKLDDVNRTMGEQISLWQQIKKESSDWADWVSGLGRTLSTEEKIAALQARMAPGRGIFSANTTENQAELARLQAQLSAERAAAQNVAAQAAQEQTNSKGLSLADRYSATGKAGAIDTKIALLEAVKPETAEQATRVAEAIAKLREERDKLFEVKVEKDPLAGFLQRMQDLTSGNAAGLASNTVRDIEQLGQALDAGKISADKYNLTLGAILDKDPELAKEQRELEKSASDAAKANLVFGEALRSLDAAYAKENLKAAMRDMPQSQRDLAEATAQVVEQTERERNRIADRAAAMHDNVEVQKEAAAALDALNEKQAIQLEQTVALWEAQQRMNASWQYGARTALRDFGESANNVADLAKSATSSALSGMEEMFVQWETTGKLSSRRLTDSIIADLMRITTRENISGPLAKALAGMLGASAPAYESQSYTDINTSGWSTASSEWHTGGVIGADSAKGRIIASSVFANANRYHGGGLVTDEVPIIAKKGEGVFTPEQMKAMGGGNVSVTIINNSGAQVSQREVPDGRGGRNIEVEIGDAMARQMMTTGSPLNRARNANTLVRRS